MNADYVENIIRNIDKQSYKCILVDGAWGIGKSYMVRKALEDKLYYKNDSIEKENTNSRYRKDGHILSNHLNVRLANYVCLQSSGALLDDIYNYFKSSKMLSEETLQKHYQKFKEAGDKANYYKTDEEIETYIQSWKAKLHEASNSVELTQLAGEYDYWFQVLEKDDDELIEYYRDVLKNMFLCENRSDKRSPLDYYNSNEFHGATEKIRNIKALKSALSEESIPALAAGSSSYRFGQMPDIAAMPVGRKTTASVKRQFTLLF